MVSANPTSDMLIRLPGDNFELPEVDVAIVMESTYPFLKGGVSAVVHDIITNNPDLTFGIIHIAWDSHSPREDLYGMPFNVAWVDVLYLSLEENKENFNHAFEETTALNEAQSSAVVDQLFRAFDAVTRDNPEPLWRLYDEAVNPLTRDYSLWSILRSRAMMDACVEATGASDDITLGNLFWLVRDFVSLAFSLMDRVQPAAKVYHSHTTGYASLVAACGARQHRTSFLLTEHNLYVRDTVNTLLDRRMDLPVTRNSYRELPDNTIDRFWTRWWTEMGAFLYPSTNHITYLYPAAIREAAELGGDADKSEVLPNGMEWKDFEYGRNRRKELLPEILAGVKGQWRFACIARVVPIKGIIELIDSVALLVEAGHHNFTVDVLGPTEHIPEYYEQCVAHVKELGMEDKIIFRGTVAVRDVLHDYDALVLSSFNEGQPIVVLEAMACGLPVIGTEVGGMDQVVRDPLPDVEGGDVGPCGLLFDPGDVEGLASGMSQMMEFPELYEQWHYNALARLQGTFLISSVMRRYNSIYRRLGAGGEGTRTADLARTALDISFGPYERYPRKEKTATVPRKGLFGAGYFFSSQKMK